MLLNVASSPELTSRVLEILHEHGIKTAEQLLTKDLHLIPLKTSVVLELQQKLYSKLVLEPRTLSELYKRAANNQAIISTGNAAVDEAIGGGFLTGEHIDICGHADVLSNFCLQAMSVLLRKNSSCTLIYIDTGSNFHPEKLVTLFNCKPEQLKKVQVVFVEDILEVLKFLDQTHRGRLRPEMVVINSFVDIVKPFMINNDPSVSLGILNHLAATIRSIAEHLKLPLLTTNELIKNEPALGKMWSGAPHMRLHVKSLEDVVVMKSTRKIDTS